MIDAKILLEKITDNDIINIDKELFNFTPDKPFVLFFFFFLQIQIII